MSEERGTELTMEGRTFLEDTKLARIAELEAENARLREALRLVQSNFGVNRGERIMTDNPTTISVEEAGRLLGVSRNTAYELIRQRRFPVVVLRVGHQLRVPKAPLMRLLGIDMQTVDDCCGCLKHGSTNEAYDAACAALGEEAADG